MSDWPVNRPILTDALVARIHADNIEAGVLERAYNTSFRHSDAGKCARAMTYSMLTTAPGETLVTNPPDIPGEWVMSLGILIHEHVQSAIQERWGSSAEIEAKVRHGDLASGHCDAVISHVPDIGTICFELKTRGVYGFDKAVGINRKAYALTSPEGPGAATLIQGALNALGANADLLVIGIISMEAISKQLAERVGWNDLSRIMAEWHYERKEWLPWAQREIERMTKIRDTVDKGYLPDGTAVGDEFQEITLNPLATKPSWQCVYCSYRLRCVEDCNANTNELEALGYA